MNSDVYLASTLSSLKFISSSQLAKTSTNSTVLRKYINEFKKKLFERLDSNELSDTFLKNAAECLYDLKACDKKTSYHLSRAFESRAGVITNQLKGGVLWAFYRDPLLNRARKKVINASCRVAIKQATKEFLDLKENVTNITRFEGILRNLKVVGNCYKLPVSAKARLEQSILESSEVLKLSFECMPLLSMMCEALCSLQIDNEKIGAVIVEILTENMQKEMMSLDEISSIAQVLYKWKVERGSGTVQCIELLKDKVEGGKYDLTRNTSNTVKLFTEIVRLPKSRICSEFGELILRKSENRIEECCSNRDLLLFFNSIADFKKSYPDVNVGVMDNIVSNVETFLLFGNTDVKREDVDTVKESCKILKDHVNVNRLLEMATNMLEN
ncbi:conserved hypothetical protein [Theileria orientalis strain Shintoku]|uniref:Uncharacterized protein n=1 Tax=Theileria orientalis strain Shintoku TaxID=869250 RepID=J4CCP4_THEOR|nr:conserved hypothetical protein [Theileria orientalis strain Shintoku]PVC50567.1 hypothetical protein MACL_00002186 [Theileria orientalis]BAM39747.1 conserved hypothetical protein [Theileria orientalis strain Shintoku]|eukprot:XP_009690048.1 conserved hypothetical protein [Theileria orientalis strain Shintoku]